MKQNSGWKVPVEIEGLLIVKMGKENNDMQLTIILAKEFLGHNPVVTLEEGILETIEWMHKVYQAEI